MKLSSINNKHMFYDNQLDDVIYKLSTNAFNFRKEDPSLKDLLDKISLYKTSNSWKIPSNHESILDIEKFLYKHELYFHSIDFSVAKPRKEDEYFLVQHGSIYSDWYSSSNRLLSKALNYDPNKLTEDNEIIASLFSKEFINKLKEEDNTVYLDSPPLVYGNLMYWHSDPGIFYTQTKFYDDHLADLNLKKITLKKLYPTETYQDIVRVEVPKLDHLEFDLEHKKYQEIINFFKSEKFDNPVYRYLSLRPNLNEEDELLGSSLSILPPIINNIGYDIFNYKNITIISRKLYERLIKLKVCNFKIIPLVVR